MVHSKVICLISGGIDSPVATYTMIRKGLIPIGLYIDCYPFTSEKTEKAALDVIRVLAAYTKEKGIKTYVVPQGENLEMIKKKVPQKFTCIFCKRSMYMIAEKIAEIEDAAAIVTGEIIGEQASQTTRNLYAINQAINTPIVRPLIGFDKEEVTRIGRKIGTVPASILQTQYCSAVPDRPVTHANIHDVLRYNQQIGFEALIDNAIKNARIVEIRND